MEILLLPLLVFVSVITVIVLYNKLTNYKKRADKSWQVYRVQLKKKQELQDANNHSFDAELENSRLDYNKKATAYNRIIQKFPTSFMAEMAGYKTREIYEDRNR